MKYCLVCVVGIVYFSFVSCGRNSNVEKLLDSNINASSIKLIYSELMRLDLFQDSVMLDMHKRKVIKRGCRKRRIIFCRVRGNHILRFV